MAITNPTGFELTDEDLDRVLEEVEQELVPVLKSANEKLSKADEESSPDDKSGPPEKEESSPAEESSSEGSAPSGDAPPPPGPEASASPEGSAPPAGPEASSPAPGAEGSAGPGGLPTDPAQLQQMIASLPPEAQKAIYLAAKQAIFAQQSAPPAPGAEGSAPPMSPPGAPPAGPGPEMSSPPPASPPAGPPVPPMGKGEVPAGKQAPQNSKPGVMAPDANGDKVLKSEIEGLKKLIKSQAEMIKGQHDQFVLLEKAVTHMAATPIRKAITGVSHIAKSESGERSLSKAEVVSRVNALDVKSLSKKDKDAVLKFFDSGSQNIDLVKHLVVTK
jgi:hypothetical protein